MQFSSMQYLQDLKPTPEHFYKFYDLLDGAENLLSFGAAFFPLTLPVPACMIFGNAKIITGIALIALGLLMTTSSVLPFSSQTRVNLIHNSYLFIGHGVGNVIAGSLERHLLLSILMFVVRVAIRSVLANRNHKSLSLGDWFLQRKLFKVMKHIERNPRPLPDLPVSLASLLREIENRLDNSHRIDIDSNSNSNSNRILNPHDPDHNLEGQRQAQAFWKEIWKDSANRGTY